MKKTQPAFIAGSVVTILILASIFYWILRARKLPTFGLANATTLRPTITLWPLPIQGNGNQF